MKDASLHPVGIGSLAHGDLPEVQLHDHISLLNLIKSCQKEKDLLKSRTIHSYLLEKHILTKNVYIGNALVTTYAKCGVMEEAREVFEQIPIRNAVTWNALISGYAQNGFGHEALRCFRQMKDEGICPDVVTYTCVLKACGIVRSLEFGEYIDAEVRNRRLLEKDVMLGNALVDMYCKCGAMEKAQYVFEQLPEQNVVTWSALITGYIRKGLTDEGLKCFRRMKDAGIYPNVVTYTCILKACGIVGSLDIGEDIVSEVREKGLLGKDILLNTALVDMYSKCGALTRAQKVFDQLHLRDIVSWNALISGYAQSGLAHEALKCFRQIEDEGVCPDAVTYICILKACAIGGSLEIGECIDARIRRFWLSEKDLMLGNALVDMYSKCGALKRAQEVFELLPDQNVVSWSALIGGYVQNGLGDEALKCFREMKDAGVYPDVVTYVSILKACGLKGCLEIGEDIDSNVRKKGLLEKDIMLGTAVVDMYCKCGVMEKAQQVFNQLPTRGVMSWNSLIAGYIQNGLGNEALKCVEKMKDTRVEPDKVTYVYIMKACGIMRSIEIAEDIHMKVRKQGLLDNDVILGNALVDMYCKCGLLANALDVFDQLPVQTIVSWNALIAVYTHNGLCDKALKCFLQMRDAGVCPNTETYISILKACGIMGSLEIGEDIDAEIRKQGLLEKDIVLMNALVGMYSKCGVLEKAGEVFEQLPVRDVVSCNALIAGYGHLGQANVVLEYYNQMCSRDVVPNSVTFIVLLNACSHAGLVKEGERLFNEMCDIYNVTPTPEHYTCMIDLFGRAGCFDKMKPLLDKVPDSGYIPLLRSILASCRKWRNVKLGRWAFKQTIEVDKNCGAAYVNMGNIYAAAGMQAEADRPDIWKIH